MSNVAGSDLKFTIPLTVYCDTNLGYVLQALSRTTIILLQHFISDDTKQALISFLRPRKPFHKPLQVLDIVRFFHDLIPIHAELRKRVETSRVPAGSMHAHAIKIDKQNAIVWQVQYVLFPEVTEDELLCVK